MVAFSGAARRITAEDVETTANSLGCDVAALRAVMAVESRNSGFDNKHRPIILFEPHVFYRNLREPELGEAVKVGIAYPRWGEKPYPRDDDGNYDRLSRAIAIDEEAAFRSISIGLGQILGENHVAAGYPSATEMFKAATESEGIQLDQMAGFIRKDGLEQHLIRHDWEAFARGYNGPGQVLKYSRLLEENYKKWSKIVETPRKQLTADDLKNAGSRTVINSFDVKKNLGGLVTTVSAAAGAASQAQDTISTVHDTIGTASDTLTSAQSALVFTQSHWQWIAFGIAVVGVSFFAWRIWNNANAAIAARVDDAQTGANSRV